jgi:cytochrome P450
MKNEMTALSVAIAASAMFGINLEKDAQRIMHALETATGLFGRISLPYSEWLLKIPLPATIKFKKAKAELDAIIMKMIAERRQNASERADLLSILLKCSEQCSYATAMSEQQLRDETLTLFLTAFDTTSVALTWAWFLISQNPGAETELHAEVDKVLQGRVATAADIGALKYTRMVFGESMRLLPPSYLIPRQAITDLTISGFDIPRGSLILMSPYLIHHDARFHPDPETFNPHAWEKHAHSKNAKYEYLPFSRGPRSCIGESFAWMQGIIVLATIAQSWKVRLVPGHRVEFSQLINLRPKHPMIMELQSRKKIEIND